MIREVILDTETTGLSPLDGHRIVEIGAVELLNHLPSGATFHAYLNPERDMPSEAEAIHGLSLAFLKDKPVFSRVAEELLAFVAGSTLVIHNASFDISFLNAELAAVGRDQFNLTQVVDTLRIARQKHPMASNSLDALCKRYGIDNAKRSKHGALLDAELLAEVYLELIGGRQTAMNLAAVPQSPKTGAVHIASVQRQRPAPLPTRLTSAENEAHRVLVSSLGPGALWKSS